jgi:hypothetical protein
VLGRRLELLDRRTLDRRGHLVLLEIVLMLLLERQAWLPTFRNIQILVSFFMEGFFGPVRHWALDVPL